jgi:hypothetical protein
MESELGEIEGLAELECVVYRSPASFIFCMTWSRRSSPPSCRGGYSLKVFRNFPT